MIIVRSHIKLVAGQSRSESQRRGKLTIVLPGNVLASVARMLHTASLCANILPCSRCNISFVRFAGTRFKLARRFAQCNLGIEINLRNLAMTRILFILIALCLPVGALAQNAPPKVGKNLLAQVKPKEPVGCKLIGTVRGTKLWAGDCVGSELTGSTTAPENRDPSGTIAPDPKE
jgi:hypothetical protein